MQLNPAVPLAPIDPEMVTRLGVAAVLGVLLGLDREIRGYAAGLRTHGIICVSASVMTVSMIALYHQFDGTRADPLRVFEAIGAFVGVIGAGLIVFSRGQLHNLTTAAHIWLTAVIGVACGAGQWPLVATAAVIGLVLLTLLTVVEGRWSRHRALAAAQREKEPDQ